MTRLLDMSDVSRKLYLYVFVYVHVFLTVTVKIVLERNGSISAGNKKDCTLLNNAVLFFFLSDFFEIAKKNSKYKKSQVLGV